jgi:hypothetical protein
MLDQVAQVKLNDQLWNSVPSRTELPADEDEYLDAYGPAGAMGESRRQYLRIQFRETALLVRGDQCHAIYTKDASPKGVALLTPVQIFPQERIKLVLRDHPTMELELRRCRRLASNCYECGTVFADGVIPPAVYKHLIHSSSRKH